MAKKRTSVLWHAFGTFLNCCPFDLSKGVVLVKNEQPSRHKQPVSMVEVSWPKNRHSSGPYSITILTPI